MVKLAITTKGQTVQVLAENERWIQVKYPNGRVARIKPSEIYAYI